MLQPALLCALTLFVQPASAAGAEEDFVLVMLRSGSTEEGDSQELGAGHMRNIQRLSEEGTLLCAGPMAPPLARTDERGIFVLKVPTFEAAREALATDPAIAAGALVPELHHLRSSDPIARLGELERAAAQAREALEPGSGAAFDMRPWVIATAAEGDSTRAAEALLRRRAELACAGTLGRDAARERWLVLDAQDLDGARTLLARCDPQVEWALRPWYASSRLIALPRLAKRPDAPTFELLDVPQDGRLSVFHGSFARYLAVFGVHILVTAGVPDRKALHAAHLLAQYIDNDEDGEVDDERVHQVLTDGGAFLILPAGEHVLDSLDMDWEALEKAGLEIGQDLYAEETLPDGPPHRRVRGRFDAALEEVWHLVSNGWEMAYPESFGYQPGSALCDAMDAARGGRFQRPPRRYPEGAWYHYDDRTCDYGCMAAEYFYWTLTTLLGGQEYPGRAEEIAREWECPTAALLEERDVAVHALLTDPRWRLPKALPDGSYGR